MRRKELEIEFKICHDYLEYPYVSSNEVSERDFDILLDYFRSRSIDDMVKGYLSHIYEDDNYSDDEYDETKEMVLEMVDFDMIDKMVDYYEDALVEWRKYRGYILEFLPEDACKSYTEMTKHIHYRLYTDLWTIF